MEKNERRKQKKGNKQKIQKEQTEDLKEAYKIGIKYYKKVDKE